MHNTFATSEYSLIDQETHLPKPNYWAAYLWAKLMGTQVYEVGKGQQPGVYLFAHNTKGQTGSMTFLVINTNEDAIQLNIPSDARQYTLTSTELEGTTVQLNGSDLKLDENDELPAIEGRAIQVGDVSLPGHSITFLTFSGVNM